VLDWIIALQFPCNDFIHHPKSTKTVPFALPGVVPKVSERHKIERRHPFRLVEKRFTAILRHNGAQKTDSTLVLAKTIGEYRFTINPQCKGTIEFVGAGRGRKPHGGQAMDATLIDPFAKKQTKSVRSTGCSCGTNGVNSWVHEFTPFPLQRRDASTFSHDFDY